MGDGGLCGGVAALYIAGACSGHVPDLALYYRHFGCPRHSALHHCLMDVLLHQPQWDLIMVNIL